MKKKLFVLGLMFYTVINQVVICQSLQDTKDFIREKIDSNAPLPNYDNFAFFEQNILKNDADVFAGKTLSDEEFNNMFLYGREIHDGKNKSGGVLSSVAQIVDIRGIVKVSTTRKLDDHKYFIVTVYVSDKYFSNEYLQNYGSKAEFKNMQKMEIFIGDDSESALKIKKAIIHLGQLSGNNVRDGDIF